MSSAFGDGTTCSEIVNSDYSQCATCGEILVVRRYSDWHKFITFSLVGAALQEILRVRFANVPVSNLSLLANWEELIVVKGCDTESIDTSHALCLISYSFLLFKIPAQNWFVSSCSHQMNIIRENLNPSNLTCVFLEMRYELSRPNLPNSDLTFLATRADKLIVVAQAYSSNSIFMCVINLPKWARSLYFERADAAIRPAWNDDFICKKWAQRGNTGLGQDGASSYNWIVVRVPKTDGAVLGTSWEFVRYTWHKVGVNDCLGVVFTQKHFWKVTHSHAIDETFVSWR